MARKQHGNQRGVYCIIRNGAVRRRKNTPAAAEKKRGEQWLKWRGVAGE